MSELMDAVSSRGPPSDTDTDLGTQLWRLVYEGECGKSVRNCENLWVRGERCETQ